jgi:hypothetical protein
MKIQTRTLAALGLLALASASHGATIFAEDFDSGYSTSNGTGVNGGASLAGQNPANSPFNAAWTETGTTITTVNRTLSWESTGAGGRAVANDTSNSNTAPVATRTTDTSLIGNATAATYFGFDISYGSTVSEGGFATIAFGSKTFFGAGTNLSGNFALFSSNSAMTGGAISNLTASANTTYRLVIKVTNNGTTDPISLFVNPASDTEPGTANATATGDFYVPDNASFRLSGFRIGKSGANSADDGLTYFDNFVVSTDFATASGIPEPSVALSLIGGFGLLTLIRRRRK